MKEPSRLKYGRASRRLETRKHQREASHRFHPRELARAVAHAGLAAEGATGVNSKANGAMQSRFSIAWRTVTEQMIKRKAKKTGRQIRKISQ